MITFVSWGESKELPSVQPFGYETLSKITEHYTCALSAH